MTGSLVDQAVALRADGGGDPVCMTRGNAKNPWSGGDHIQRHRGNALHETSKPGVGRVLCKSHPLNGRKVPTAVQIKIKGLWVVCTNPAHSWINQNQCRDILDRLDFLVVQDMYANTETAEMADLVLPAAGWGRS